MPVTARSFAAAAIALLLATAAAAQDDGDFQAHSRHHRRAMGMGHSALQPNRPEPHGNNPDQPASVTSDRERRGYLGGSGSGSGSGSGGGSQPQGKARGGVFPER